MFSKLKGEVKLIGGLLVGSGLAGVLSDAASKYVGNLVSHHPKTAIVGGVAAFIAALFKQPAK